ncbi:MAG: hypothetical protein ABIZ34_02325 [Candidatus Limnocylindrales bacterium]
MMRQRREMSFDPERLVLAERLDLGLGVRARAGRVGPLYRGVGTKFIAIGGAAGQCGDAMRPLATSW